MAKEKERRDRHKKAGLCISCDQPVAAGRGRCRKHLDMCLRASKIYFDKNQSRRIAEGLCRFCERKRWLGKATCRRHTLRSRAAALRYYKKNRMRLAKDRRRIKRIGDWKRRKIRTTLRYRFKNAKFQARQRGISWTIPEKLYGELIVKPCEYCELPNNVEVSIGLDRLDNSRGYTPKNVVSCCRECNLVRGDRFTPDEMRLIGAAVRDVKLCRVAIGVAQDARGLKGWA